jgi:DNA-binding NtrC family response regulator
MAEIMVLDDVRDATILIGKILSKEGHTVHEFNIEEEAIAHAEAHKIDLAILDIKLKTMNGVEVLARLKEVQPEMKAIMLTGYPTIETVRESMSLGVDEYCVKPIDRDKLASKVKNVLKSKTHKSSIKV